MARDNAEIVIWQLERWNEGDIDAQMEAFDPDVEIIAPKGWPEGPVINGLESWRLQSERLRSGWDDTRVEIDEVRAEGADRIIVVIRYVIVGDEPGLAFESPMTATYDLRDGKITRAAFDWLNEA